LTAYSFGARHNLFIYHNSLKIREGRIEEHGIGIAKHNILCRDDFGWFIGSLENEGRPIENVHWTSQRKERVPFFQRLPGFLLLDILEQRCLLKVTTLFH
jgi:hypothetical protein